MTRYGMLMDVTKCNGCYNCFLVCKDEHCGRAHPGYSAAQPMTGHAWISIVNTERGRFPKVKVDYTAIPCMHCDDPACVAAADKLGAGGAGGAQGAIYKRKDGIVLIDPDKAKGKKELVCELSLPGDLLERRRAGRSKMHVLRSPLGRWLERAPLRGGLPDRGPALR